MYTISMRPYCPDGTPNKCINFEQERASWGMSTFKKEDSALANTVRFGLIFTSPLERVDISVIQLAAMIAGVDAAYEELCNALYADAPKDLASTPWRDLDTFMACIPRGVFETEPDSPTEVFQQDVLPVPFLYDAASGRCLSWTGSRWGIVEAPADVASFNSAGTCFGWSVLYKEETMSAECVQTPESLSDMLVLLMETLAWLNTDAKVYVRNIYSVQ